MAHDVFICYSKKDKPTADAVCAYLENAGIRCWIAPRDILPGCDWGASIIEALGAAKAMVLVFSSHSNDSPQVKREVQRAFEKGITVIPLRCENVEPNTSLEYYISSVHWLDAFTPPLEAHFDTLAHTLSRLLAGGAENPESRSPAPPDTRVGGPLPHPPGEPTPAPSSANRQQSAWPIRTMLLVAAGLVVACGVLTLTVLNHKAALAKEKQEKVSRLLVQAQASYDRRDLEGAAQTLGDLLKLDPENIEGKALRAYPNNL